jgi:mRNA interferase MazF
VICDFGDVVVVPFPFVEINADKRRPSLVLSRDTFTREHGHSICAMITTARRTHWASDVAIDGLTEAGLPRACVVRWKLFTLPNDLIDRRIGTLARSDRDRVLTSQREILA